MRGILIGRILDYLLKWFQLKNRQILHTKVQIQSPILSTLQKFHQVTSNKWCFHNNWRYASSVFLRKIKDIVFCYIIIRILYVKMGVSIKTQTSKFDRFKAFLKREKSLYQPRKLQVFTNDKSFWWKLLTKYIY